MVLITILYVHHNPVQDWLPYFHNHEPSDMQANFHAPAARNRISDLFAINQSSAVPHYSNTQFAYLAYDSLFQSQPIVTQPIRTQATGAPAIQGPYSFAEVMQSSSTRIYEKKRFYAILDPRISLAGFFNGAANSIRSTNVLVPRCYRHGTGSESSGLADT